MLGLIAILAIFATVWSAKELKIISTWGKTVNKRKAELADAIKKIEDLSDVDKGVPSLENKELLLTLDRSESWRDCELGSFENVDGKAQIGFKLFTPEDAAAPTDAGMKLNDTVYVFDQRPIPDGGKYLGFYRITSVRQNEIYAESIDLLNGRELDEIKASLDDSATLSVFSSCPTDRPDLFAGMSATDKEKYLKGLPQNTIDAYAADDYQPIHFGEMLAWYYKKRIEDRESLIALQSQKKSLNDSQTMADEKLAFYQNEIDRVKKEIGMMDQQADVVKKHRDDLENRLKTMEQQVVEIQKNNEKMMEDIQKSQTEMLKKSVRSSSIQPLTR